QAAQIGVARPGETISTQGQPADGLILLLQGTMDGLVSNRGSEERVNDQVAPTWIGAIPTLLEDQNPISLRARTDVRFAIVATKQFVELVLSDRSVFRRVMAQVRPVIGRITQREQNRERLASLGTMAAGLAHELNNPASAARRAAAHLQQTTDKVQSFLCQLSKALEPEHWQCLLNAAQEASERKAPELDHLARSDQAESVAKWLEAHDV